IVVVKVTNRRCLVPASAPRPAGPEIRSATTTTTTKRPHGPSVITGNGFKCVDHQLCPTLVRTGFCNGALSPAGKMKFCPKSCGFC
ncbi:shTK domain protein, partial [Ostertagia ostertagi]